MGENKDDLEKKNYPYAKKCVGIVFILISFSIIFYFFEDVIKSIFIMISFTFLSIGFTLIIDESAKEGMFKFLILLLFAIYVMIRNFYDRIVLIFTKKHD